MTKSIIDSIQTYYKNKYKFPRSGSYLYCRHYWFENKIAKDQFFLGRCLYIKRKGLLSSLKMRTFCYKTIMESIIFMNSPNICLIYSFTRNEVIPRRMSFLFLRREYNKYKARKSVAVKNIHL